MDTVIKKEEIRKPENLVYKKTDATHRQGNELLPGMWPWYCSPYRYGSS
jgi:hypothetical protein